VALAQTTMKQKRSEQDRSAQQS